MALEKLNAEKNKFGTQPGLIEYSTSASLSDVKWKNGDLTTLLPRQKIKKKTVLGHSHQKNKMRKKKEKSTQRT